MSIHYARSISIVYMPFRASRSGLQHHRRAQERWVCGHTILERQKLIDIPSRPSEFASQEVGLWAAEPYGKVTCQVRCIRMLAISAS